MRTAKSPARKRGGSDHQVGTRTDHRVYPFGKQATCSFFTGSASARDVAMPSPIPTSGARFVRKQLAAVDVMTRSTREVRRSP